MHPYKVSTVQQLLPQDFNQRLLFCQWFNDNLNNNDLLDNTFYSDEAWFHLSGYVNSQNYRIWSTVNPHVIEAAPLHPLKVGVWVAMSRRRIIGPIFFYDTINAERYQTLLLQPFIDQLHDDELTGGYFQQDSATAHTAHTSIQFLEQFFPGRLISRGIWPSRSPDLTPLDFFFISSFKKYCF